MKSPPALVRAVIEAVGLLLGARLPRKEEEAPESIWKILKEEVLGDP